MSEALIKDLLEKVAALTAKVDALSPIILKMADVAAASQLDSDKGDPDVPFDPKAWRGASFKGKRFSEAPAELLDMLGDFFTWSANNPKEGKEQYAGSDRRKASLAYGWAYRKRTGGAPATHARGGGRRQAPSGGYGGGRSAAPPPADEFGGGYGGNDDDIPF
jgi:hypothetical protein